MPIQIAAKKILRILIRLSLIPVILLRLNLLRDVMFGTYSYFTLIISANEIERITEIRNPVHILLRASCKTSHLVHISTFYWVLALSNFDIRQFEITWLGFEVKFIVRSGSYWAKVAHIDRWLFLQWLPVVRVNGDVELIQ